MKHFLILLMLSALLPACKTSFRISVKEPAYVKLPEEVTDLGILNNVNQQNSPEEVIEAVLTSQSLNGNVLASQNAAEGLMRSLNASEHLYAKTLQDTNYHRADGSVDWERFDTICARQKVQGVVEFTTIKTVSPIGGSVLANATGQSYTRLEGYLYANVYLASSHEVVERLGVRRYYSIPLGGSSIIAILNDVQRKQQYYRALGYELGYGLGELLYPNWVWVDRRYYTKGSKALKQARPMIRNGNWDIAEKALLQDSASASKKVRGRIFFNLALVKEGQGDLASAIAYAEKSALECGNKSANAYLVQLRQRAALVEQL